ncbi:MAG: tripartite tricarboxylate transporter TctB family protein [Burkholderiales bacterium]
MIVGGAIVHGGWTMDRLERLNINPYTAPGLVPAMLGAGIAIMGFLLMIRALRAGAFCDTSTERTSPASNTRLILASILCVGYGAGLVGRGLPFWLATFLFVFVSIAMFRWSDYRSSGQVVRGLVIAAVCGAATAIGVTLTFQEIFLVRLP